MGGITTAGVLGEGSTPKERFDRATSTPLAEADEEVVGAREAEGAGAAGVPPVFGVASAESDAEEVGGDSLFEEGGVRRKSEPGGAPSRGIGVVRGPPIFGIEIGAAGVVANESTSVGAPPTFGLGGIGDDTAFP